MNAIPLTQSQELGQIASQHFITLPRGRVIITLSLSISLLFFSFTDRKVGSYETFRIRSFRRDRKIRRFPLYLNQEYLETGTFVPDQRWSRKMQRFDYCFG